MLICFSCPLLIAQHLTIIQELCNVMVHVVADVFGRYSEMFAFSGT